MAVTINDVPGNWSPSDNPLKFEFSSNQTAQPNFSFIVRTFLNGVQVAEDQVFIEVSTKAHYDCSPIVKNLMPKPTRSTVLWRNAGINAELYVVVYEKYGATPALQSSTTSSTVDIFKGCLSDYKWDTYLAATYQNLLFFTNYPRTERIEVIRKADVFWNLLQDASKTLEIKLYGSDGIQIGSTYSATQNYHIGQLNTNSDILISTCGFSPTNLALAAYYTVQIGTAELLTVYFKDDYCGDIHGLQWLNEWGAFDSFIFEHNLELSGTIEDKTYGKQFGYWNGTSFDYDVNNAGTTRYDVKQKDTGTVYTGWITQAQQNWLVELYKGSMHLLQYLLGVERSVRLTSNQFTFQQQRFEELISEAVAFEFSNDHNGVQL